MNLRTHVAAAPAFYLLGSFVLSQPVAWPAVGMAVVGSVLPEVDKPDSLVGRAFPASRWIHDRFGHRGITHSLLGLAIAAALSSPLAFFAFPYWLAFLFGYFSHLFLDMATLEGIPLFWPKMARCVFPGRDDLRLDQGNPRSEKKEFALALFFVALSLVLVPLAPLGPQRAIQRVLGTMEESFGEYRSLAGSYEVFLVGRLQEALTGQSREGKWPIVALTERGYLVLDEGKIRLVGPGGSLVPLRVALRKGQPITVVTTTASFSGELRELLRYLDPGVEHYLSGRVKLARSISLPQDPEAFPTVRGSSELSLSYARWQDLAPLASEYVTEATVVIVHRLRPGQSLQHGSAPELVGSVSGELVPVTITVRRLSDLMVKEGQFVAEGEPLAQDQEEIEKADRELAHVQARYELGLASAKELARAEEEAQKRKEKATVCAPLSGTIKGVTVESASLSLIHI